MIEEGEGEDDAVRTDSPIGTATGGSGPGRRLVSSCLRSLIMGSFAHISQCALIHSYNGCIKTVVLSL